MGYNVIHEISRPRMQMVSVSSGIETEVYDILFKTYAAMTWGYMRDEVNNTVISGGDNYLYRFGFRFFAKCEFRKIDIADYKKFLNILNLSDSINRGYLIYFWVHGGHTTDGGLYIPADIEKFKVRISNETHNMEYYIGRFRAHNLSFELEGSSLLEKIPITMKAV